MLGPDSPQETKIKNCPTKNLICFYVGKFCE